MLGDQIWLVVLVWLATQHASPAIAGLVIGANSVPRALLLLGAGPFVDRHDPVRVAVLCDYARTAVFVAAAIAAARWHDPASVVLILGTVGLAVGVFDAYFFPASASLRPRLLDASQLTSASAAFELVSRVAMLAGPPVGAAIVGAPLWAVCLVNAATFAISGVFLRTVKPRPAEQDGGERRTVRMLVDGLTYVGRHGELRTLALTLLVFNLALQGALGLGSALIARKNDLGATAVGTVFAAFAVGAIAATIPLSARQGPSRPGVRIGGAALAQALGILGLAFSTTTWHLALAAGWAGAASSVLGITASARIQAVTRDAMRGRVNAVVALANYGLAPLGMAGAGLLSAATGPGSAVALLGALEGCAAALYLLIGARRVRASHGSGTDRV